MDSPRLRVGLAVLVRVGFRPDLSCEGGRIAPRAWCEQLSHAPHGYRAGILRR